jgi:hypothetical protein
VRDDAAEQRVGGCGLLVGVGVERVAVKAAKWSTSSRVISLSP